MLNVIGLQDVVGSLADAGSLALASTVPSSLARNVNVTTGRVALLRGARVGARLDDPERVDHRDQRSDLVRGNDLDFERRGVAGHGPRDIELVHTAQGSARSPASG